jgi:post-segregation antitoxin (ccd killing protein)
MAALRTTSDLEAEKHVDFSHTEVAPALRAKDVDISRLPQRTLDAAIHIDPQAEKRLVWKLDLVSR